MFLFNNEFNLHNKNKDEKAMLSKKQIPRRKLETGQGIGSQLFTSQPLSVLIVFKGMLQKLQNHVNLMHTTSSAKS